MLPPPLCSVEAQFLLTGEPGLPVMPSLHSDVVLCLVAHMVKDFISFIVLDCFFLYCFGLNSILYCVLCCCPVHQSLYFCCPIILFGLIWFQP